MEILASACAILALLSLIWMGWIDLKLWILPNELVLLLGITAIPFHYSYDWLYGGWLYFVMGGIVGSGILMVIRSIANRIYGFETLGLGDIKLMGAVGLWLGPQGVLMALSFGALCGVFHAIIIAKIEKKSLKNMMLPAGPGFIAGTILISFWTYKDLIL
jgi:leader peptidase (prepilin peptidase)/N-methyltransferase